MGRTVPVCGIVRALREGCEHVTLTPTERAGLVEGRESGDEEGTRFRQGLVANVLLLPVHIRSLP